MWSDALKSVEGIIGSVALILTTMIGAWLAVREAVKTKAKDPSADQVVQGQVVSEEKQWLSDLRREAAKAEALEPILTKALLRLSSHGIPHEDLLAELWNTGDVPPADERDGDPV